MTVDPQKLQIVCYPHPSLRRPARPVDPIDGPVVDVARRMLQLMHDAGGVGLAGPQVDLDWRLFVANPTGEPTDDRIFINPVLSEPACETASYEEGCLSIPNVTGQITRPVAITITALDEHGQSFTLRSDTLAARVWQHEVDHLNGVLIIDRMNQMDKLATRRTLREMKAAFQA